MANNKKEYASLVLHENYSYAQDNRTPLREWAEYNYENNPKSFECIHIHSLKDLREVLNFMGE